MKHILKILFLILMMCFSGCTSKSIVGRWIMVRHYDVSLGKWEVPQKQPIIEFSENGRYKSFNAPMRGGEYTIDDGVIPNRIVFKDENAGRVIGIYKLENGKLILKVASGRDIGFPTDFAIDTDDNYSLSESKPCEHSECL